MFYLETGVHFDEEEFTVFVKEFKGAGTAVPDLPTGIGAALTHFGAYLVRDAWCWRLFQNFLVAALHRAVTVTQYDHFSLCVGKHLKLNMARLFEVALHVYGIVAKSCLGFTAGQLPGVEQRGFGVHHPHAFAPATCGCFDDDGISDIRGDAHDLVSIIWQGAVGAGDTGHTRLLHRVNRRNFVAHQADRLGGRSDKNETTLLNVFCKVGVFGKKSVTRMNRGSVCDFCGGNDGRDVEITASGRRRADADRFRCQAYVLGVGVGFGVQRHRADAQLPTGS